MLRDSLAQIDGDARYGGGGSGFFAAPGYLLTCSHVVRQPEGGTVTGSWHGKPWSGQVRYASRPVAASPDDRPSDPAEPGDAGIWPLPDLAVVRLSGEFEHPCARLMAREPWPGTSLCAVGRRAPLDDSPGDFPTAELRYPGLFARSQGNLMRLVGDSLGPGMSGGPVLDLGTGEVCGLVKIANPGRDGYAVPLSYLRELPADLLAELLRGHDRYHGRHRAWVLAQEPLWQKMTDSLGDYESGSATAPLLRPTEEAELLGLTASVTGSGDLHKLYLDCVGPGLHPEPQEPRDLRDLVFQLSEHVHEPRRLHPVNVFAELLAGWAPDAAAVAADLRDWSAAVAGRQGTWELLRAWRQDPQRSSPQPGSHSAGTGREPMSAVVQLEPSGHAPDRYLLTVWRYRSDTDISVVIRDHVPHPREEIVQVLRGVLPATLGQLSGESVIVEFVLPAELLDEPVHLWQVFRQSYARLGYRYPVVLRDLDRFTDEESRHHARARWDYLSTCDGTPMHWFGCEDPRSSEDVYRWFELSPQHAAFGLPGPASRDPGRSALDAAIYAGVPVALWRLARCEDHDGGTPATAPCDGLRFQLAANDTMSHTPLSRLPAMVKALRAGAAWSEHALLWDNPYRGPHPRRLVEPWPLHQDR